jgi:mitotic spindle assembly checkpoint protein MAD2
VNSILFQRGLYPPESFRRVGKYGLTLLVSSDDALTAYIAQILSQLKEWLGQGDVQKLVLVVTGADTNDVLERWVFNVGGSACRRESENLAPGTILRGNKSEKEISAEIQAIIRQITASVTFLPLIQEPCTFDLLVYTPKDANVPNTWEDSDPRFIPDSADVELRSFSTSLHKVQALVSYRAPSA